MNLQLIKSNSTILNNQLNLIICNCEKTEKSTEKSRIFLRKNQFFCEKCESSSNLSFSLLTIHYCKYHSIEKSEFYCQDCNEFICCLCICKEHRYHYSNVFKEASSIINSMVTVRQSKINSLLLEINSSITDLKQRIISMTLINNENSSVCSTFREFLRNIVKSKGKSIIEQYINDLNHLSIRKDNEKVELIVDSYMLKVNLDIKKYKNFREDYEKIRKILESSFYNRDTKEDKENHTKLNNILYVLYLLKLYKDYLTPREKEIIQESDVIYKNYSNLIQSKSTYIELDEEKKMEVSSIYNNISSSIVDSFIHKPYYIRRFTSFFHPGLIYFEKSSVYIENISKFPINLIGIGVCGLVNSAKRCTLTINLKIVEYEIKSKSVSQSSSNEETDRNTDDISTIYDEEDNENQIILYDETIQLNEIDFSSTHNPIQIIFFEKYSKYVSFIRMNPGSKYKVLIKNVDSDFYIGIWNGKTITKDFISMFKEKKTSFLSQVLFCNMNDVMLKVYSSESTDLNEFSNGIVSDILYSI